MPKINQDEYEMLKELGSKWEWVARDEDIGLYAFESKTYKFNGSWLWIDGIDFRRITEAGFQFIQWENSEPYNIDELIEEYEIENGMRYNFGKMKLVDIDTSKLATRNGYIYVKESGETEVKKDIEWLKEEVWKQDIVMDKGYIYTDDLMSIINELDEPEILSQEWISEKSIDTHVDTANGEIQVTFILDDLQNLLVPE